MLLVCKSLCEKPNMAWTTQSAEMIWNTHASQISSHFFVLGLAPTSSKFSSKLSIVPSLDSVKRTMTGKLLILARTLSDSSSLSSSSSASSLPSSSSSSASSSSPPSLLSSLYDTLSIDVVLRDSSSTAAAATGPLRLSNSSVSASEFVSEWSVDGGSKIASRTSCSRLSSLSTLNSKTPFSWWSQNHLQWR